MVWMPSLLPIQSFSLHIFLDNPSKMQQLILDFKYHVMVTVWEANCISPYAVHNDC